MQKNQLYLKSFSLLRYLLIAIFLFFTAKNIIHDYSNISNDIPLPNSRIVGGDFFCFYTAGKNIEQLKEKSFYNFHEQIEQQKEVLEKHNLSEGPLPFIYPPLVAKLFSLFTFDSYPKSFFAWSLFSISLFGLSFVLLCKSLQLQKQDCLRNLLFMIAFPAFIIECLAGGQTSVLGFFIICLTLFFIKAERNFLAGLAMSLSYYKPPLFVLLLIFLLIRRNKDFIWGFLAGAALLISATLLVAGLEGTLNYITQASTYRYGEEILENNSLPTTKGVGMLSFYVDLLGGPNPITYTAFLLSMAALSFYWFKKSKNASSEVSFAGDVILSLVFSLQMVVYDLTLILLPLAVAWKKTNQRLTKNVAITYIATLGLYLDTVIRNVDVAGLNFKLTPLFMVLLLVAISPSTSSSEAR